MGNRIRMHLGVELDLTEQELEELCSSRCPQQLLELVQSKRCRSTPWRLNKIICF